MWKQDAGQWLNRRSEDAKVCVTDLIDHMITESNKIYAGTDMEDRFLMFHDALAQWNEDEAQLYIKNRYPGFENRFKPMGTTCASTIYHDMVPGNSPKNARGLDSFGFADLEYAMCFNSRWHGITPTATRAGSSARGRPRRCGTSWSRPGRFWVSP